MAFQISPGVNTSEIDLTTVVPGVSSIDAGFAGNELGQVLELEHPDWKTSTQLTPMGAYRFRAEKTT